MERYRPSHLPAANIPQLGKILEDRYKVYTAKHPEAGLSFGTFTYMVLSTHMPRREHESRRLRNARLNHALGGVFIERERERMEKAGLGRIRGRIF